MNYCGEKIRILAHWISKKHRLIRVLFCMIILLYGFDILVLKEAFKLLCQGMLFHKKQ